MATSNHGALAEIERLRADNERLRAENRRQRRAIAALVGPADGGPPVGSRIPDDEDLDITLVGANADDPPRGAIRVVGKADEDGGEDA